MKIRPYQDSDESAVVQLWSDCGLVAPQNNPLRDIQRKQEVNPEWFLVGLKEKEIVAFFTRYPYYIINLQMKDSTSIWMHLLPRKDLKVFVLDRRMDIFVPVFILPTPIKSIEINQNTLLMDIRVTKNIFIKNEQKCESKEDYVYTGTYVFREDGINITV